MFKGIRKLAPAERMTVRADGSTELETLLDADVRATAAAEVAAMDGAELEERLLDAAARVDRQADDVRRPVRRLPLGRRRLVDERRADVRADGRARCARSRSASSEHEQYNELEHARAIAQRFGTDHHEVRDRLRTTSSRSCPELIHHQDEPIADWVCVPLHYVSKLARDNGTIVVQVGEGSDELFHGYQGYIDTPASAARYWEPFQRVPAPLRRAPARRDRRFAAHRRRLVPHAQASRTRRPGGCRSGAARSPTRARSRTRVLANGTAASATPTRSSQRFWDEAERERPAPTCCRR